MRILIDFDGTCIPQLPEPGHCGENTGAEEVLRSLQEAGHEIILWTARNHSRKNPWNYIDGKFRNPDSLDQALMWFSEKGIKLDGINDLPENICASRKLSGDLLIDDLSVGIPKIWKEIEFYSFQEQKWKTVRTFWVDWRKLWNDHLKALCMKPTR